MEQSETIAGPDVNPLTARAAESLWIWNGPAPSAAEALEAARLAEARQDIASRGPLAYCPHWHELTDDERANDTVHALWYLRAARAAGLITAPVAG